MSRYTHGSAVSRNSNIAAMIESFLDDNSEYISQHLWDELEQLAGEVDMEVEEFERQVADLEQEVESLKEEIEELEEREN